MTAPGPEVTAVLVVFLAPLAASLGPLVSKAFLDPGLRGGWAARAIPAVCLVLGLLASPAALIRLHAAVTGGGTVAFALGLPSPLAIRYLLDGPAWLACALIAAVGLCAGLYGLVSGGYSPAFWFFFLVALSALYACVLTADLFNLFVSLELLALCSYVLIAYKRTPASLWASYSYLVTSTVAVVFYLLGLYFLYGYAGTLSIPEAAAAIRALGPVPPRDLRMALGFLTVALGVRSAYAPFHAWLPEAHASAPHPVSALLSGATLAAGYFALGRILSLFDVPALREGLLWAGALTALTGGLFAVAQRDAKRLLAWSSVGQAGLCLAALASGSLAAGALHALAHGAAKALLFLSVGRAADEAGSRDLGALRGGAGPGPSLGILVGAASLAGLPPLAGWASKSLAGYAAGGGAAGMVLAAASVLSAAAAFRVLPLLGIFRPSGGPREGSPAAPGPGDIRNLAVVLTGLLPLAVLCAAGGLPGIPEAAASLADPGAGPLGIPAFGWPALAKALPTLGAGAVIAAAAGTRPARKILDLWERRGTGADTALRLLLAGAAAAALLGLL